MATRKREQLITDSLSDLMVCLYKWYFAVNLHTKQLQVLHHSSRTHFSMLIQSTGHVAPHLLKDKCTETLPTPPRLYLGSVTDKTLKCSQ